MLVCTLQCNIILSFVILSFSEPIINGIQGMWKSHVSLTETLLSCYFKCWAESAITSSYTCILIICVNHVSINTICFLKIQYVYLFLYVWWPHGLIKNENRSQGSGKTFKYISKTLFLFLVFLMRKYILTSTTDLYTCISILITISRHSTPCFCIVCGQTEHQGTTH